MCAILVIILQKDIEKQEKVQSIVMKLIPGVRSKPYEERFGALNLFILTKHRIREIIIKILKIIKEISTLTLISNL